MNQSQAVVLTELKRLMDSFFQAVSFEVGELPSYVRLRELFIPSGLLIKNSGAQPEISTIQQFIQPRQASVDSGELTRFFEAELAETTQIFGNVAQRFCAYTKSGCLKGMPFEARGMISTQFVLTTSGWRMSSMAWDDERSGLSLPTGHSQPPADTTSANRLGFINHLDLTVVDFGRSVVFYDSILRELGYECSTEYQGEVPNWTLRQGPASTSIGLHEAKSLAAHNRYTAGFHHLAFHASSRGEVDAMYALVLSIGGTVLDAPAEYDYTPGYYAVFFSDPDGLKLELVYEPQLESYGPGVRS